MFCDDLEGGDGSGGEREAQEQGVYIYIHTLMDDLCCCTSENQYKIVKQLYSNFKKCILENTIKDTTR